MFNKLFNKRKRAFNDEFVDCQKNQYRHLKFRNFVSRCPIADNIGLKRGKTSAIAF